MKTRVRIRGTETGFSLLEMMIAVVILGVITSQLFLALTAQRGSNRSDAVAVDTQETTRLVLDLISLDTRNAGMLVPREVAVASVDGGSQGEDRLCVSDGSIFQVPAPGVANAFWNNLGDTFNGAVGQASGQSLAPLNFLDMESTLPVGGDPSLAGGTNPDFARDAGVIIANGKRDPNGNWAVTGGPGNPRRVFCAKVLDVVPPNTLRIDQPVPFSGEVTVVPAILYEITRPNPADPNDTLLLRNSIPISDQIEDLQVQYWVDSSPTNGSIDANEWPLDRLDGQDTSRIRRVRIYALGRTQVEENYGGTSLVRHHHPGMANRIAGTRYDNFQREVFVASVLPRNLFDYLENPNAAVANVP
jgi:prepilin-type N-terminal cleavage/methylation domain-containing protein